MCKCSGLNRTRKVNAAEKQRKSQSAKVKMKDRSTVELLYFVNDGEGLYVLGRINGVGGGCTHYPHVVRSEGSLDVISLQCRGVCRSMYAGFKVGVRVRASVGGLGLAMVLVETRRRVCGSSC